MRVSYCAGMTDHAVPSRNSELVRRIGVTLAVLALYRIASWVPLPGVDISSLLSPEAVHTTAVPRVSMVALGVVPMLSALILIEMAMIAFPRLRAWAGEHAERRAEIDGWALVLALAIAGFQANGVAVALEEIHVLVAEPGLVFRAGVIASLVGGSAFLLWLGSLITRHGIGNGLWVLVAVPYANSFTEALVAQHALWGPASLVSIVLSVGFLGLCAGVLAALLKSSPARAQTEELPWAPILGFAAANWVLIVPLLVLWLLGADTQNVDINTLLTSQGALLLPVVTIPLLVLLRRRSFATPTAAPASAVPLALAFGALVAAGTALAYLPAQPLFPLPAPTLVLAAIGLVVVDGLVNERRGTETAPTVS